MSLANRVIGKLNSIATQRSPDLLDPECIAKIDRASLLFYFGNIHSQRGQDGILAEIFRRLNITKGRFVEFGAWDGVYLSNCRYLYERGWSGVFIEGDAQRFRDLERRHAGTSVKCINAFVGTESGSLAKLIGDTSDVSFVSIDVDGLDLPIFENMGFAPPVVLVEGGFNFSPHLTQRLDDHTMQQPLPVICDSAVQHGYTPVCFYQDTYLVRSDLASPFRAPDAVTLFAEAFHFMPIGYRQSLIDLRRNSRLIKDAERKFFGSFDADPLHTIPTHAPARRI